MQIKTVNYISPYLALIQSLLLLGSGSFLLTHDAQVSLALFVAAGAVLIAFAGVREFVSLMESGNLRAAVTKLAFYGMMTVLFVAMRQLFVGMVHLILAIMFFLLAVMRLLICLHMLIDHVPGLLTTFVSFVISAALALVFGFSPAAEKAEFTMLITGLYLLFSGFSALSRVVGAVLGSDLVDEKTRRRVYYSMPNFVTGFLTLRIIRVCTAYLAEHPDEETIVEQIAGTDPESVNFEVLVHTSRLPGKQFGHVDIALDGKVYTFGNYDSASYRMGSIAADGIFAVLPRDAYIRLCLTQQQKYIIGYGCSLSERQLDAVRARIDEMYRNSEPIQVNPNTIDLRGPDGITAFANIGGQSRRVVRGNFRTYFVINANCVKLADFLIGATGMDKVSRGTIVTPGAYLCLMDSMFSRKNTRVIRRTTYLRSRSEKASEQI